MFDPAALGTLHIGLAASEREIKAQRVHRSRNTANRDRHRLRLAVARGLRGVAELLEGPVVREPAGS